MRDCQCRSRRRAVARDSNFCSRGWRSRNCRRYTPPPSVQLGRGEREAGLAYKRLNATNYYKSTQLPMQQSRTRTIRVKPHGTETAIVSRARATRRDTTEPSLSQNARLDCP